MSEYNPSSGPVVVRHTREKQEGIFQALPWVNILLFLITLCTTVIAGIYLAHFTADFFHFLNLLWIYVIRWTYPDFLFHGLPFAVTLMAILMAHELGHYLLSRHHGVKCSLPYFLPGPNLVGTFGAVIFMKSPIPDRRARVDIGAAGPLAGLAVTIFAMALGLATAEVEWFDPKNFQDGIVLFHPNLLLYYVNQIWPLPSPESEPALGAAIHAGTIINSPLLDAACVGFLVTMLNLMPIGQLDGGHIAYAVLGPSSIWLSRIFMVIIFIMGYFWHPWIFLGILLLILMGRRGLRHPPPINPYVRLTLGRKILAALILIIFILIIAPVPVEVGIPQIVIHP